MLTGYCLQKHLVIIYIPRSGFGIHSIHFLSRLSVNERRIRLLDSGSKENTTEEEICSKVIVFLSSLLFTAQPTKLNLPAPHLVFILLLLEINVSSGLRCTTSLSKTCVAAVDRAAVDNPPFGTRKIGWLEGQIPTGWYAFQKAKAGDTNMQVCSTKKQKCIAIKGGC